jgi:hypothetical protein
MEVRLLNMIGVLQMAHIAIFPVGWQFWYSIYLTYRSRLLIFSRIINSGAFPHRYGQGELPLIQFDSSILQIWMWFVQETRVAGTNRRRMNSNAQRELWGLSHRVLHKIPLRKLSSDQNLLWLSLRLSLTHWEICEFTVVSLGQKHLVYPWTSASPAFHK